MRKTKNIIIGLAICFVVCGAILFATSTFPEKNKKKTVPAWIKKNGQIYGARPDERGPIGGGYGYKKIITNGNYYVRNIDDLRCALKAVKPGEVIFIDKDVEIDCTALVFTEKFQIKMIEGLTLASDRGFKGSKGAIIMSSHFGTNPLIHALGPNIRITGLRLIGPDPKQRLEHHKRAFNKQRGSRKAQSKYFYAFPKSVGISTENNALEVDNCEISGWSHTAVYLKNGNRHLVHHNYIHHNQRNGLGYGVCLGYGQSISALIEYNLFNYNRHFIAGTGVPGSNYEARHNIQLESSLSHSFDMHGGSDRRDGTNIAGDQISIHHNTFMNLTSRPIKIRGTPKGKAEIFNNWFVHETQNSKMAFSRPNSEENKIIFFNNLFGEPPIGHRGLTERQQLFPYGSVDSKL